MKNINLSYEKIIELERHCVYKTFFCNPPKIVRLSKILRETYDYFWWWHHFLLDTSYTIFLSCTFCESFWSRFAKSATTFHLHQKYLAKWVRLMDHNTMLDLTEKKSIPRVLCWNTNQNQIKSKSGLNQDKISKN